MSRVKSLKNAKDYFMNLSDPKSVSEMESHFLILKLLGEELEKEVRYNV